MLPEVSKSESDFAFFLYDLKPCKQEKRLELMLQRVVYTQFGFMTSHVYNVDKIFMYIDDYLEKDFLNQFNNMFDYE
jgi:hypothetical protein